MNNRTYIRLSVLMFAIIQISSTMMAKDTSNLMYHIGISVVWGIGLIVLAILETR